MNILVDNGFFLGKVNNVILFMLGSRVGREYFPGALIIGGCTKH